MQHAFKEKMLQIFTYFVHNAAFCFEEDNLSKAMSLCSLKD
jgi:hypothetical protein